MRFTDALIDGDIAAIRKCPKADLHNHFVLGGSRKYLLEHSGRDIRPITNPLNSMDEMHAWNGENIGSFFDTTEGRRMLPLPRQKKMVLRFLKSVKMFGGWVHFSITTSMNWWMRLNPLIGKLHRR